MGTRGMIQIQSGPRGEDLNLTYSRPPQHRMLSRVAEAIYWFSRYVERAENVARFVDVNLNLMLDTPVRKRSNWQPLVMTSGDQEWFSKHYSEVTPETVAWFLTFDREYPNSIFSALAKARENAQTVREVISRDMWQQLNAFYLMVEAKSKEAFSLGEMSDFYSSVKLNGIYHEGVTQATLSRGEAWQFTQLGRLLERADKTSRILDVKYYDLKPSMSGSEASQSDARKLSSSRSADQVGWAALLNSASALQMYRQQYHEPSSENVANFLLFDRAFPRSIYYCVNQAQRALHGITGTPLDAAHSFAERRLGQLRARLSYTSISDVMTSGLHETIDEVQVALNEVSRAIGLQFFHYGSSAQV